MRINLQELRESLTEEHIIKIVTTLGAEHYEERVNEIIFPTICHNIRDAAKSMKLYYYKDSHMFHCYTECAENFDIFDLIKKVKETNGENYNFYSIVCSIADLVNFDFFNETTKRTDKYVSELHKISSINSIDLKVYDNKVLETFKFYPTIEWLQEGISSEAMKRFNILYYQYRNKIIIPHYNIKGELIGIRTRTLEEDEEKQYGKYMPLFIEDKVYKHPLSFNLYGINENKDDIKKYETAIIYEGEKSVLQMQDLFDYNISVASCGSSLNYRQIEILVKECGVKNIILAYDKEYSEITTEAAVKYYNKLEQICQKYINYCNFSFIYDFDNLLKEKQSPIDKGKEVFEKLMEKRIQVRLKNAI